MNAFYFKTVFTIIAVSLLFNCIYTQENNIMGSKCANITVQQSIPTSGTIKALIIYIKFLDDSYESAGTYDWPHIINGHLDERPAWTEYMLTKNLNN